MELIPVRLKRKMKQAEDPIQIIFFMVFLEQIITQNQGKTIVKFGSPVGGIS